MGHPGYDSFGLPPQKRRDKRHNRSLLERLFWSNKRSPIDLNFTSPFANFNVNRYSGPVPPPVLLAAWMLVIGTLTVVVLTVCFGAIFGLFGLAGPSWIESIALLIGIGTLTGAFNNNRSGNA